MRGQSGVHLSDLAADAGHELRRRQLLANLDASLSQPATSEQSPTTPRPEISGSSAYDFLVGRLIDAPTLGRARSLAFDWQVSVPRALAALGWVSEADFVEDPLGFKMYLDQSVADDADEDDDE